MNGLRLANSMATVLSLLVHRRVPIGIVKNNAVCTSQVNADAAAPC